MLYGSECQAIKKVHKNKLNLAKMRMLRWMSSKTRKDNTKYEYIEGALGVAQIKV